jgi:hypothetical protein
MEDLNIALLIDADNVSSRYISGILSELSKYGKITIRRMYGDWSQDRLHSWMKCSSRFSLTPIMQPNNTPGKNASDIGLIIDAMDILYTGDVQGFCIVSSDGDFNKLATRLREAGKFVIGMGEKKTPESFRVSCERFIFLDVIESEVPGAGRMSEDSNSQAADAAPQSTAQETSAGRSASSQTTTRRRRAAVVSEAAPSYKSVTSGSQKTPAVEEVEPEQDYDADSEALFTDKATIENAIVSIITDNSAEGKETGLGEIGSRLVKIFPDFDVRNYHYSKLSEYLKDFSSLKVENRDNAVWVSLNSSPDSEIEQQILRIFKRHGTDDMYMTTLKKELLELNPNLDASIRRSGVTRFSVYLHRMIGSVEVNGRHVLLKKKD